MSQSSQSQSPSQSQSQSQVLFAIYEDVKPLINLLRAINFAEVCNHIYTFKKEKSHLTNFDLQAWLRSHSSQKATCLSYFILHPIQLLVLANRCTRVCARIYIYIYIHIPHSHVFYFYYVVAAQGQEATFEVQDTGIKMLVSDFRFQLVLGPMRIVWVAAAAPIYGKICMSVSADIHFL